MLREIFKIVSLIQLAQLEVSFLDTVGEAVPKRRALKLASRSVFCYGL